MTTPPIGATVTILASVFGREGQTATVVPATVRMLHFPVCVRFADNTTGFYCPSALQVIELPITNLRTTVQENDCVPT